MTSTTRPTVVVGAGQAGLATARALRDRGLTPLVLEAGDHPDGAWPAYYDSLRLFSPARHSGFPGFPFDGDPDRYPHRDDVVRHLHRYADHLGVEIRTRARVTEVRSCGDGFEVRTADGAVHRAGGVVAATGSFGRPHRPQVPGLGGFAGRVLHVADYRGPEPFAGSRVVVVGGGNSGVQVAHELEGVADVVLATRRPVTFAAQRPLGLDVHRWFALTGFDRWPSVVSRRFVRGPLVLDDGTYRRALAQGAPRRRPVPSRVDGDVVVWPDGSRERVDAIVLATGYRPAVDYLRDLGALDVHGAPRHRGGVSTTHPGLGYVGLELQRTFASATLRGVHADAAHVVARVAAHARGGRATVRA